MNLLVYRALGGGTLTLPSG